MYGCLFALFSCCIPAFFPLRVCWFLKLVSVKMEAEYQTGYVQKKGEFSELTHRFLASSSVLQLWYRLLWIIRARLITMQSFSTDLLIFLSVAPVSRRLRSFWPQMFNKWQKSNIKLGLLDAIFKQMSIKNHVSFQEIKQKHVYFSQLKLPVKCNDLKNLGEF